MTPYRDPRPRAPARLPAPTPARPSFVDRRALVGGGATAVLTAVIFWLLGRTSESDGVGMLAGGVFIAITLVVTAVCAVLWSEGMAAWRQQRAMRIANERIARAREASEPEPAARVRVAAEPSAAPDSADEELLDVDDEEGAGRRGRSR
ncbi:MAG: hypothetical protein JNL38_33170 [Myxococcales bacterium]|nr:hypothetical protein [Myxococcales bacterium]